MSLGRSCFALWLWRHCTIKVGLIPRSLSLLFSKEDSIYNTPDSEWPDVEFLLQSNAIWTPAPEIAPVRFLHGDITPNMISINIATYHTFGKPATEVWNLSLLRDFSTQISKQ
jgi:hypothetical protein